MHRWSPWRLGAAVAAVLVFTFAAARARDFAQDEDEPPRDGKWLYTRNCAGCHNDNGDGRGATILQLGLTARDFKEGAFAFGDSRAQMIRTVESGVPGRSPMPGFKGILSADEIELVVEHVRTLMPPRAEDAAADTVMLVGEHAVVARGKLPAMLAGARETPRGVLVGTPQGLTLAYNADPVRLIGAHLGAFADREDWHDRGGGHLKPLGVLIHAVGEGRPPTAARLRLAGTWTRGANAGLVYDALDPQGAVQARIDESVRVEALSVGAAFTRVFTFSPSDVSTLVALELCDEQRSKWVAAPRAQDPATNKVRGPAWWVCDLGVEGRLCVLPRGRDGARLAISWEGGLSAGVPLKPGLGVVVEASYVRTREWSQALGEALAKELGQ